MKSVVVFSGGMDSTVVLYQELNKGHDVECITFDYGSKHNSQEYKKALETCKKLDVKLTKVSLPLDDLFKSDLLKSGGEVPEGHYEDNSMKKTVVPFRNGIMLSIACGYAESIDFDRVVLGNHAGDHAIYPDCRKSFIESMSKAMKLGTYSEIEICSPFCEKSKRDIAVLGSDLNVNWSDTWSCYNGREKHCGKCGTCVERIEALKGFDSTEYE